MLGTILSISGALLMTGSAIATFTQFFDYLINFLNSISLLQLKLHTREFEKQQKLKEKYEQKLLKPQNFFQYWWMEFRLANLRASARYANEIVRNNREKFDLHPSKIIDHNGFLLKEKIVQNKKDISRWLEQANDKKPPYKTPKIALPLLLLGVLLLILGEVLGGINK